MKHIFFILSIITLSFSCTKETTSIQTDYDKVIDNVGLEVILPVYQDLYEKSVALDQTLQLLQSNPNIANLESARQAWRDCRVPWEQSEGFLFGPVDQQGIDPAIDSWPVNETDLNEVLNTSLALTKEYLDGLDGTLKGFHTIEYLIFGKNGNKLISEFTSREFEYLSASSLSLKGSYEQLFFAWKEDKGNYIQHLLTAGAPENLVYPSQKSALQEIVVGMITIADEVANGKINEPLVTRDLTFEESRFSANSKRDFSDNIRSIKLAYTGLYKNANGLGISSIIKDKNSELDNKVRQQIEDAIFAIESIQGTFTTAVIDARESVIFAQQKVRDLQETLESNVLPLISNL